MRTGRTDVLCSGARAAADLTSPEQHECGLKLLSHAADGMLMAKELMELARREHALDRVVHVHHVGH